MLLYENTGTNRSYRSMYMPYAKKFIPKLLKEIDDDIRSMKLEEPSTRLGYLWSSETEMFGSNETDSIVAIVDSRASGLEIMGEITTNCGGRLTGNYKTYSYHVYGRGNNHIGTWERSICDIWISKCLVFKLGWLKEIIHYGT